MVETTHQGIWMADLDGICTFVNPQMARMLGSAPEQILGRPVLDFVFEEDRAVVRQHFTELLQQPGGRRFEERLRRGDGSEIWALVGASVMVDAKGRPASFLGMFNDITERVRGEAMLRGVQHTLEARVNERTAELQASNQALADSEEKYRRLFETISDAAFVFDGETRHFLEVNEAALRLYGYTREEFLQLTHTAITAEPEDSEASIQLALAGAAPRIPMRHHRKKDGTIFPVEIAASTFMPKGRPVACGVIRDITRRVELEREILAISEREQRRRGHDLHDDLCQQLAGIEFLSRRLASDLTATSAVGAAQAAEIAQMLQRAMAQTRELARGLSPVGLDARGLPDALRKLAAGTRKLFGCNCRFRYESPVLLPNHSVANHLYRIAQEAVNNAFKHGQARRIDIRLGTKGRAITLTVTDNGLGLSRELPARPGMGLRIMRYRARAIGGALRVEARPRGGTRVLCAVKKDLLPPPEKANDR